MYTKLCNLVYSFLRNCVTKSNFQFKKRLKKGSSTYRFNTRGQPQTLISFNTPLPENSLNTILYTVFVCLYMGEICPNMVKYRTVFRRFVRCAPLYKWSMVVSLFQKYCNTFDTSINSYNHR